MPRDENASIVQPHNVMYYGERPRTVFKDWYNAIHVVLKNGPAETIFETMAEMREASYSPNIDTAIERAQEVVYAQASAGIPHPLSLSLEVPHFTFLIMGVSRAMTHQIVRARIGVTYAQKCTGDGDIRHDDALVPRGRWREDTWALEEYINSVVGFKLWYARLIDAGESIHIGRYLMPHCLSQYIYMDISLLALMMMYGKRTCPEQPSEWGYICRGFKEAMEPNYPEFATMLVSDCDRRGCHWHRRGNNNSYLGRLYFPDEAHDVEPWNPQSFLHQGPVELFEGGEPFETRGYVGAERMG